MPTSAFGFQRLVQYDQRAWLHQYELLEAEFAALGLAVPPIQLGNCPYETILRMQKLLHDVRQTRRLSVTN